MASAGPGSTTPSIPSDTPGDAFAPGASNSVAANAPTLVQTKYNSNCNSASCGLAFTSSVVSGNTLVFGLGWYSVPQTYAPVTLTNNQACALGLDGSASGSGAQSASATLTTTCPPDVIYVSLAVDAGPVTGPPAKGLTFTLRGTQTRAHGVGKVSTYYAIASSALSSELISATSSGSSLLTIIAWGISGP